MASGDPDRFRAVLDGLAYPARTWQLCAQADAYGADSRTREALSRLPVTAYASLDAVLTQLRDTHPDL
jgi:Protein of unknown function (DUF2795)